LAKDHRPFGAADAVLCEAWKPKKPPVSKSKPPPKRAAPKSVAKKLPEKIPAPPPPVEVQPESRPPSVPPPPPVSKAAIAKALQRKGAPKPRIPVSGHRIGTGTRPVLKTNQALTRQRAASKPVAKKPKERKLPPKEPPLVVTDKLLREIAEKAFAGFSAPGIAHVESVLFTMCVRCEPGRKLSVAQRKLRLIAHVMECLSAEAEKAKRKGEDVTQKLLHARACRLFGEFVSLAEKRLRASSSMADEAAVRRRLNSKRTRMKSGELDLRIWNEGDLNLYFLVEVGKRRNNIHLVMSEWIFQSWIGSYECCHGRRME
jgi:hypothetical protein